MTAKSMINTLKGKKENSLRNTIPRKDTVSQASQLHVYMILSEVVSSETEKKI
jgi:hypothetical protein